MLREAMTMMSSIFAFLCFIKKASLLFSYFYDTIKEVWRE